MILRSLAARATVAGVTTAMAAGALVGATTVAADAATAVNTYTCSIPSVYSGDFDLTVTGELPVPQYWAGAAVPAGLLSVTAQSTVPADAAGLLGSLGYTGAKSTDFAFKLGTGKVPVPLTGSFSTSGADTVWDAAGSNKAFITPAPGTYDAVMPAKFSMTTTGGSNPGQTLTCLLKSGQTPQAIAQDFKLNRQSSKTVSPSTAAVRRGRTAVLPVKVTSTSLSGAPILSGKVVAKEGGKVLGAGTVKNGKAAVTISKRITKKLKLGKHTLVVSYVGTPSVKPSSDKTILTVKR